MTGLNKAFDDALQDKSVRERARPVMGFDVAGGPPERLADTIRSETKKWKQVIDEAHINLD